MFSLRKLVFGDRTRVVVSLVLYAVFFAVVVEKIVTAEDYSPVVIYSIFLVFLAAAVLNELLRFNYIQAVDLLQKSCDPARAREKVDLIRKYDIIKGYRPQLAVLEAMISTDNNAPQEVIDLIENREGKLFSTESMRAQGYYHLFKSYVLLRDKKNVKRCYKLLKDYKESFKKPAKRPVGRSVWEVIDGDYYLAMGNYDQAAEAYDKANIADMTNRDLAHYYLSKAKLAESQNDPAEMRRNIDRAMELAPQMGCILDFAESVGYKNSGKGGESDEGKPVDR